MKTLFHIFILARQAAYAARRLDVDAVAKIVAKA